jgi:spoIIIJ-associated protein
MKEIIETGKSIEEAIENGCNRIGKSKDDVTVEIVDMPKKGFLGIGVAPARVKLVYEEVNTDNKKTIAKDFLEDVLKKMGVSSCEIKVDEEDNHISFTLEGDDLGFIIGRRGETLDAIQYLVGLVANKIDGEYTRITLNSGNFREKREATLKSLAYKIAKNTKKTGKSVTLEPMNPYERRIIHAAIAEIDGVTSKSIGEETNRRVVISSTNPPRRYNNRRPYNKEGGERRPYNKDGRRPYNKDGRRPYQKRDVRSNDSEHTTVRSTPPKEAEDKPLYSKIEVK